MGRVQLYCPTTRKTIDGFVIGAYQKPEQVLQGVRLALDIRHAALYTIEAKHISDPQTLQEDDRVLVAASEDETMLPDAPYGYVRYDGEEGEDIDPDTEGYGQDWQDLTDHEKCLHITSLAAQKPMTRNKLRITREYHAVREDMLAIQQQDLSGTDVMLPTAHDEALIQERWGVSLDVFLRQVTTTTTTSSTATSSSSTRHASYAAKSHHTSSSSSSSHSALTPCTIAALAVLSSLTHGQARLAGEILSEAIALRNGENQGEDKDVAVLREDDVRNAVEIVFERAGVVPVKLTKGKKGGKARKRAKERARKVVDGGVDM